MLNNSTPAPLRLATALLRSAFHYLNALMAECIAYEGNADQCRQWAGESRKMYSGEIKPGKLAGKTSADKCSPFSIGQIRKAGKV